MFKDRSKRYKTTADPHQTGDGAAPTLLSLAVIDKPVPPILALTLIRQVAEALAEASQSGLVHKNLRPETILLDMNELPVVLNFDSTTLSEQDEAEEMVYASPEQKEGKVLDSRSNIYTLGIILYELLYGVRPGEMPFPEQDLAPAEDGELGISPQTLRVVDTCRKEQAWARYQNYTELLAAIDGALTAESTTADSPTVPTAAAGYRADGREKSGKLPANAFSLNNRWLPILATILFLALLGVAMVFTWNRTNPSSAILILEQLPLLMGGENSPARQTAVSEEATATIRALQIRLPSRTPTPPPTVEAADVTEEPPIAAGSLTETPTPPSPTPTATATSTSPPPPPPPSPTETPTETPNPTSPPTPTPTNTPPPPPPPGPTTTPQPSPTNVPTTVPTEPPPTASPLPPTPTPPILPTSTSPPTSTPPI